MKTKTMFACVAFLVAITLVSCSRTPREADGKKIVAEQVTSESEGYITVASFTKTNGVKSVVFGVEYYEMEYSMVIEFQQECWKAGNGFEGWFTNFRVMKAKPTGWDAWNAGSPKHFMQGDKVTLTGKLVFHKTEKGWQYH